MYWDRDFFPLNLCSVMTTGYLFHRSVLRSVLMFLLFGMYLTLTKAMLDWISLSLDNIVCIPDWLMIRLGLAVTTAL